MNGSKHFFKSYTDWSTLNIILNGEREFELSACSFINTYNLFGLQFVLGFRILIGHLLKAREVRQNIQHLTQFR